MESEAADEVSDGPLDPRIQIELENLNSATDDINKLEIKLDEATLTFNKVLTESIEQLKGIIKNVGSGCIQKARCYYEVLKIARQAQVQCQHQTHLYQRASEMAKAAKETVAVAEVRFLSHKHEWKFDQNWQDMLNHATIKVMETENHKSECEREHRRKAILLHEAEKKAQELEEKYRKSIIKTQTYFDVFSQCEQKLSTQKERIKCLEKAVKEAKHSYAKSFRALEQISNEIHEQRRVFDLVQGPREPGVGAELISPPESLNYEEELNKLTRINSNSSELNENFGEVDELRERIETCLRLGDGRESTSDWHQEMSVDSWQRGKRLSKSLSNSLAEIGSRDDKAELQVPTDKSFKAVSVNSTPVKFVRSKMSSRKELPLLSIFEKSEVKIEDSKNGKKNLKELLDCDGLKSIQVSSEKSVKARDNLLKEYKAYNDK